MTITKRILVFPFVILVAIATTGMRIIVKAECWIVGIEFPLLTIFIMLAFINKMWLQLGLFAILFVIEGMVLFASVYFSVWLETVSDRLRKNR